MHWTSAMLSLMQVVNEGSKSGNERTGETSFSNCVNSALSVGQSVSFYSPISKSQLKTFEHMNAKTSLKCKSGEIITNIHETRRVGLYIKGVSHGFVQMVYYCLDLFLISLQSCLLHFSCEVLLVHVIPALSCIATSAESLLTVLSL
jgi:hypothetical protein